MTVSSLASSSVEGQGVVSELSKGQYSADVEEERDNGGRGGHQKALWLESACHGDMRQTEKALNPRTQVTSHQCSVC